MNSYQIALIAADATTSALLPRVNDEYKSEYFVVRYTPTMKKVNGGLKMPKDKHPFFEIINKTDTRYAAAIAIVVADPANYDIIDNNVVIEPNIFTADGLIKERLAMKDGIVTPYKATTKSGDEITLTTVRYFLPEEADSEEEQAYYASALKRIKDDQWIAISTPSSQPE